MKFRIRHADQIVGIFVILAFVLLASILVVMGGRQRWFARDYPYVSRFPSSTGLAAGTSILYKGFQIGRIRQVSLNGENEVDVSFVIFDTYVDRVRENSILELVISPIGLGNQLLFHPGRSDKPLEERSFIPSLESPEGRRIVAQNLVDRPPKDDTITRLISNVNPLIENVNATVVQLERALGQVNDAVAGTGSGPVADSLRDASAIIAQVNETVGSAGPRVDRMMADVEGSLPMILARVESSIDSVKALAESAVVIGKNFEATSEALRDPTGLVPRLLDPKGSLKTFLDDGDRLFNRVDNSLAEVEQALGNLEGSTAALAAQMPRIAATIDDARAAIVSAQDVLEGLKNNPLLRGGIPERVNPQAAPTSLRTTDF